MTTFHGSGKTSTMLALCHAFALALAGSTTGNGATVMPSGFGPWPAKPLRPVPKSRQNARSPKINRRRKP